MEVEVPILHSTSPSSSPEFEFWMVRNPSYPPSNLLTADELFVDGVLLPLQLLSLTPSDSPAKTPSPPTTPPPEPSPSSILFSSSSTSSSISKRWKDLFKVASERKPEEKEQEKDQRKKDRKSSAELNINLNLNLNIWPFTRSSSAGGLPRSTGFISGRKVSSAPCSRSNSRGESSAGAGARKSAASPGRAGVHLGRTSPVRKIRRAGAGPREKGKALTPAVAASGGGGAGVGVLNLNVNSCIGYGEKVSSRGEDSDVITVSDHTVEGSGSNGSLFGLRALFSKKV